VTASDPQSSSVAASLRAAGGLAWSCAARLLAVRVLLTIGVGSAPVAVAWLMKVVLDRLVERDQSLLGAVLLLAGAGVAVALLPEVTRYVDAELQRAITLTTRERLYAAVGRLAGLRRFENPRFHDRLSLATQVGPTGPSEMVNSVFGVVQGALTLGAFLTTLAVLNPWMLLVASVAAVPALRAELQLGRQRARMVSQLGRNARREFFYAELMTSVIAAKEVRLYGLSGLFGARMFAELRQIQTGNRRMDRRQMIVQCLQGLLGAAVAGGGLIWAVYSARDGRLTIGDVSVFVAAMAGVQGGIATIIANTGKVHEAMLLFDHYRYVVEAQPDLAAPAAIAPHAVPPLRRGIELRDVWFRYDDDLPWTLRGVNLTISASGTTALVGRNGAGKSTLVKLLCRFYDPTQGSIHWDGIDLREFPVDHLRERIGAVFQDFMRYELSAADNIGVGDLPAMHDRERIEAAARLAGNHETLSALPNGYDTLLTKIYMDTADRDDPSTGVELSGGQWQRLALARALFRDRCDLLILDEPSSGLDAEAESEIRTLLAQHRAGRTSLLISHRLNTIRDADTIVVLSSGTVAEQGNHAELVEKNGLYARLFRLQADGYEFEPPTDTVAFQPR